MKRNKYPSRSAFAMSFRCKENLVEFQLETNDVMTPVKRLLFGTRMHFAESSRLVKSKLRWYSGVGL